VNITAAASAVNTENWLPAVGYEGVYEISDHGRVKRVRAANSTTVGRILKPRVHHTSGYIQIDLCVGGCQRTIFVHRLVLVTFAGPCPIGQECRHLDGDPTNNRLSNLAWGTHSENEADKLLHGTTFHPHGERNENAKLAEADVCEIRTLLEQGLTQRKIADRFGVDRTTISRIKCGKTWFVEFAQM